MASQSGHFKVVKLLLNAGAEVDPKTEAECTPLHVASQLGYFKVVKLLLAAGADVQCENNKGYTPLQIAKIHGEKLKLKNFFKNNCNVML